MVNAAAMPAARVVFIERMCDKLSA